MLVKQIACLVLAQYTAGPTGEPESIPGNISEQTYC